jgi:tetratricopeptide (TPR) repeat protein
MTPEVQGIRQARKLVESLFAESLPTADVRARIRRDPFLSREARRSALESAEPYGKSLVLPEAERLVESLYTQVMLRPEGTARRSADASLGGAVRRQAHALAECIPEDTESLERASRAVLRHVDAEPTAYRRALRPAEATCRLVPNDGGFLTILGMARYRPGQYEEAVATLTEADAIRKDNWDGLSNPEDLAFLALARHRLGQTDQALALLKRLRETMKSPRWAHNGDAQAWLHEAEAIDLDIGFPADPFASGP